MELLKQQREQYQPEQFSDNETEYDLEEAEALMNNVPSLKQRLWSYWTPEYEARRQARKRLWSPPYTPDEELGEPSYSLQPSQRPPSPSVRRYQQSAPNSDRLRLRLPKAQQRVRKARRTVYPTYRPTTRSIQSSAFVSLHDKKGHIVLACDKGTARMASFDEYLGLLLSRYIFFLSCLISASGRPSLTLES
ncbi:MAG: hypothetical protein Q9166_007788 [cf. Caloplaca sp. 2 TL-2023]